MTKKEINTLKIDLDGKILIFETGKIARQANASVLLHSGETTILSTACSSDESNEDVDFLPLRVDYLEKFSAAGKTTGGFIKREGKPSQREILTSRFIDRSIRPLFEDGYFNEVQILSYVFSYDGINTPDVLSICAASCALLISDIPFMKPLAAVRVGLIDDLFVINPNPQEQNFSKLDLVLSGTKDAILMIEGYCDFLEEEKILEAIDFGHNYIRKIIKKLEEWQKEIGKEKNLKTKYSVPQEAINIVTEIALPDLEKALKISNKKEREHLFKKIKEDLYNNLLEVENPKFLKRDISVALKKISSDLMRTMILKDNLRIDGRKFNEIRNIEINTHFLPRTHGNALFTRGETQTISVCTLGPESMGQKYETLHGEGIERFYLQYFFPPFSVGEVGRLGIPGRREIGHGKLAERALASILPDTSQFPYVIRLESNITESNGSSSMASVCGGCLALMDAGVPIKKAVSGIAMGLILDKEKYVILSDIIGTEDALGDMDFKITGDENGITAFQMDIKVEGITKEIMEKALIQAKEGRIHILQKMLEACPKPKEKISEHAPKIATLQINPSKIGLVIGSGGKQIKSIVEETNVEIDISNSGLITLASDNSENIYKALDILKNLTSDVEIGKRYKGKITTIKPFGLFIKIFNNEGFCHISEISHTRIKDLSALFKEGDVLEVEVLDINDRGQISLSHKTILS